jgi:hypothetical protein
MIAIRVAKSAIWIMALAMSFSAFVHSSAKADVLPADGQALAELKAFSQMMWSAVDSGRVPEESTAFLFSDSRFNSPLFSPVRGAVRSLQSLDPSKRAHIDDPASMSIGGIQWNAVRDLMTNGRIETNFSQDPSTALLHLQAIFGTTSPSSWTIDGDRLVSVGMKPIPIAATGLAQPLAVDVPTRTLELLAAIAQRASSLRSELGQVSPRQHLDSLIRWEDRYFEVFASSLHPAVSQIASSSPLQMSFVEAAFGVGDCSLVLILIQLDRHYVLIDPILGNTLGPFNEGTPFDATPLLLLHAPNFLPGDIVEYVFESGAVVTGPSPIGFPESSDPNGIAIGCVACLACVVAVTSSCSILCLTDNSWDTPGEGFVACMGKCGLHSLGMPLELIGVLNGTQELSPGNITMTACASACGQACTRSIFKYLKKWAMGPSRITVRIPGVVVRP